MNLFHRVILLIVTIKAALWVVILPFLILVAGPNNIREARLIEKAPRHTITVTAKRKEGHSSENAIYWITFREPVANTQEVQITRNEWNSLPVGGRLSIAILPDGRPHSLNSGADVAFEQILLAGTIVVWLAATTFVVVMIRLLIRSSRQPRLRDRLPQRIDFTQE